MLETNGASAVIAHVHRDARLILALLEKIVDATIAARRHAPLEAKIKIREHFGSHYVAAAAARTPVAFGVLETTRLNAPAFGRLHIFKVTAPSVECLAVEKQLPTDFLLSVRKSVERSGRSP